MIRLTHSPDLLKLKAEGYEVQISHGHLVVHNVPYLGSQLKPVRGILVSTMGDDGGKAVYNGEHVMMLAGEKPLNSEGGDLDAFSVSPNKTEVIPGVRVDLQLSAKRDYEDYYRKVSAYVRRLRAPLIKLGFKDDARTFKKHRSQHRSPFIYEDTNSSRAGLTAINDRVAGQRIAIVGVGGTGSYLLDLLAKNPVKEIHVFDGDVLLSHNAFRAPGAPTRARFKSSPNKAEYHTRIYRRMHKGVVAHAYGITADNLNELGGLDFVFLSMDGGANKQLIINYLIEKKIPFINVGLSVRVHDDKLRGQMATTLVGGESTEQAKCFLVNNDEDKDDAYKTNAQIAELNSLNAVFAVLSWKRYTGIYDPVSLPDHSVFKVRTGSIIR